MNMNVIDGALIGSFSPKKVTLPSFALTSRPRAECVLIVSPA